MKKLSPISPVSPSHLLTRRDFGRGLAAILSAGAAPSLSGAATGGLRRGLAARVSSFSQSEDQEEEMYKELFMQLAADKLPSTLDLTLDEGVGRDFWMVTSKVVDITLRGFDFNLLKRAPIYASTSIKTLRYPDFTYISYAPSCVGSFKGTDLYIPNVRRFGMANYSFFSWESNTQRIHIEDSCANIRAYQNFPGSNVAAQLPKMTFIGTDGKLTYNSESGEWDFTANS